MQDSLEDLVEPCSVTYEGSDTLNLTESEQLNEAESQTQESTWCIVYRGVVDTLSHSNIGQIVIRAINQAKLKIGERRIKATIKTMIENEDITVVGIDVLDELGETIGTIDVECERIDDDLYPGEVIEISLN